MEVSFTDYLIIVATVCGVLLIALLICNAAIIYSKSKKAKESHDKEKSLWPEGTFFNHDFHSRN